MYDPAGGLAAREATAGGGAEHPQAVSPVDAGDRNNKHSPVRMGRSSRDDDARGDKHRSSRGRDEHKHRSDRNRHSEADDESREEMKDRRRRDEIREERRRERERERRLESNNAHPGKKSKMTRDRDRDIGEKIALGQANVGNVGTETMYDQRLFNQDQGMDSGFGADDGYNLYDKKLFAEKGSGLYRPNASKDDELYGGEGGDEQGGKGANSKVFKPDKGFAGTDNSGTSAAQHRDGPVAFEREADEVDPFGLEQFLTDVKKGKGQKATDVIGKGRGTMHASGGASSLNDGSGGSGRQRLNFQSGRG